MKPKFKYAKREDIPAGYEALYTEVNGEWVMTEVEGLASHSDVTRLNEALRKERNDHKTARDSLTAVTSVLDAAGVTIDDLGTTLADYAGLKAEGGKAGDVAKLRVELATLQRTNEQLVKENGESKTKLNEYAAADTKRTIHSALDKAASAAGIKDAGVLEDIRLYSSLFHIDEATGAVMTREGYVQPEVWLTGMKESRAHWFPASEGGGARGNQGGGNLGANPWTNAHWNLTEQAKIMGSNRERAEQLAKQAGTSIGGARPEK